MKVMMVDDVEENQGWMVSGHETVFCWVPVTKVTMVV
jgi:hypothetical protein